MRRIFIHLSGHDHGGVLEIEREHIAAGLPGIGFHAVIGSGIPTEHWATSAQPSRLYDARIEVGRSMGEIPQLSVGLDRRMGFDGTSLALCIVASTRSKISRRQSQVAAQICSGWKWEYRIREDMILPSPEIESGAHQFDMDEFRELVRHWERSSRIMRQFTAL